MTRDQLVASLTATTPGGWYSADAARYVDWSSRLSDGTYVFEACDGGDAVQVRLTRDELAELHRTLTITLLADS